MEDKNLFTESSRLERWIQIQKTFLKFICHKSKFTKEQTNNYITIFEISPYEVIQSLNEDTDEYSLFQSVFISKSNKFQGLPFVEGIDYIGLCNTGTSLLIKNWNNLLFSKLKLLNEKLKNLAYNHKLLVQIGRTHGIHAEPTSFGYRFALIYSQIKTYIQLISEQRPCVEIVTFDYSQLYDASIGQELQSFLAKELELFTSTSNGSFVSRNAYDSFITTLNSLVQTLNKHTSDFNLLSEPEVGELKPFPKSKEEMHLIDLSSKKTESWVNLYKDLSTSINLNNPSFFKKEEECLCKIMKYVLDVVNKFTFVINNIEPEIKAIENNLSKVDESIYSQKLLLHLIQQTSDSREVIADELKKLTALARLNKSGQNLKFLLAQSKYGKYLEHSVLEKIFDKDSFLINIDNVYERIFGDENKKNLLKKTVWGEEEIQYALEHLAEQLNKEYSNDNNIPVTVIAFAERSLVFAGNLLLKLRFPISLQTIPYKKEDLDIASVQINKELIQSKRVLVIDVLINKESNLDRFIEKLNEIEKPLDIRVCTLLKTNDVTPDLFTVHWTGFECPPDDFYAGFGKNCGSRESFRTLPIIGLAA